MVDNLNFNYENYIGRELSWLRFNRRVLLQAAEKDVPILERIRFCSIFTSNLDEFYMVRVGSLHDRALLPNLPSDNKTGLNASAQLRQIYDETKRLYTLRDEVFEKVTSELKSSGVHLVKWKELDKNEKRMAKHFFKKEIVPLTQPYIIDQKHPFPHLHNRRSHILLTLRSKEGKTLFGIVPIPDECPSLLILSTSDPKRSSQIRCITADSVILHEIDELYKKYTIKGRLLFRITRNADIEIGDNFSDDPDDSYDYPTHLKILLEKRDKLCAVRLEYLCSEKREINKEIAFLQSKLGLTKAQCFRSDSPLSYRYLSTLITEASTILKDASYLPIAPILHPASVSKESIFKIIAHSDILLNYPYHSMRTYLDFLREAVYDPRTLSISITLYRLSEHSQIISLLRTAAEIGVKVTAVVELKARFDEENNIHWAQLLEESGCRVIYGMAGLKVHSKVTLVTQRANDTIRQYAHIGTGNYNEQTAKLYTDLSILTADPALTADAEKLFQSLSTGILSYDYRALLVAPTTLKRRILDEIGKEKSKAISGKNAYICIKMNSLTDKDIIDALIDASAAGVKIDLIIRGICCLAAGVPGKTENIRVISIVGRYLEHSRIFIFGEYDGNITNTPRVYIGSADMMTRNTSRRIEVITPILDETIAGTLCELTKYQLRDNVKASEMLPDGTYKKRESEDEPFDSQIRLYKLFS